MLRVRVFVDFWNFQLNWNDRIGRDRRCNWPRLPVRCVEACEALLRELGAQDSLRLDETRVYASYNPSRTEDTRLKRWLDTFLDRQPSFALMVAERKDKPAFVYCRSCGASLTDCPACHAPLVRSREKGVDTAIATDLLALAWDGAYDVGVLVSSDADMIPAVRHVQQRGTKIINAAWANCGHDLARSCWGSFDIEPLATDIVRLQQ